MTKKARSAKRKVAGVNFKETTGKQKNTSSAQRGENKTNGKTRLESRFIEAKNGLSTSRKRLLNQILDEHDETFFLSSREMAKRYDVDSSTIVRTIQAMGYEKYADFTHDLRNHFVNQITPYRSMKAAAQKKGSVAEYIKQSIDQDLENLHTLSVGLDPETIIDFAKQIHNSKRILVVGIDFAASLAMSLSYGLVRVGYDSEAPTGTTGIVQNKVRLLTKNDLLIAISFGKGLRETIEAVKKARAANVSTFGITDGDETPIAKYCDKYIIAPTVRTSFLDSYVAPVATIDAILVACAHNHTKRALDLLAKADMEESERARWYQEEKDSR